MKGILKSWHGEREMRFSEALSIALTSDRDGELEQIRDEVEKLRTALAQLMESLVESRTRIIEQGDAEKFCGSYAKFTRTE